MKKIIFLTAVLMALLMASAIFVKPLLVAFAKKKIQEALPGSRISVGKINLYYTPWSLLRQKAKGDVLIDQFQYDRFKARNIVAKLRWEGRYIFLDALSGKILNGTVEGKGSLTIGRQHRYLIQLNFADLDLVRFVKDFRLKDKVEMTGLLSGRMILDGVNSNIDILNGNFAASAGGKLTIKDIRFLENMARSSKLPADIVVDSFRDFHYNMGSLKMFLDKGDLVLDIFLEGPQGKRNLNIYFHKFSLI